MGSNGLSERAAVNLPRYGKRSGVTHQEGFVRVSLSRVSLLLPRYWVAAVLLSRSYEYLYVL